MNPVRAGEMTCIFKGVGMGDFCPYKICQMELYLSDDMVKIQRIVKFKLSTEEYMKKSLFILLFGLSLILASCGSGGASTTIDVTMTDFVFTPAEATVPAGAEITLNATNNGAVLHEYVIFKLGLTAGEKFGDEDEENIYWEMEVDPGQSKTETFTAPTEPGEYYVTCGIAGHLEAGMNGKLIVVPGK